jgi:molybdenum cofactor cytidylyltransferase
VIERERTVFLPGRKLTLAGALGVAPREIVALVGAGGKTSALLQLAKELTLQGGRVLVTTTTHIYPPSEGTACTVVEDSFQALVEAVGAAIKHHSLIIAARGRDAEGKLTGIEPAWIGKLREELPLTYLLVEADGARGRAFKAPAEHEPVIPSATDRVVPVVGLSVIGQPLSAELVHRPERVAALAAAQLGDPVTPAMVAAVLRHPAGTTRGAPAGARIVPLLNQADDDKRLESGQQIARELRPWGATRIVIAALREATPVRELAVAISAGDASMPSPVVAAIVLAAGEGRRMGSLKLALRLGTKTLLQHVTEAALAAPVQEVVVVLGHGAAELKGEVPGDKRLRTVYNPDYAQGQSASLRVGIESLSPQTEAALFLLGDQPLVRPESIAALIDTFRNCRTTLIQPLYRGVPGHPVLFARALFPELLQVTGDRGGRDVLIRHREDVAKVDLDLEAPEDVDTKEDYLRLLKDRADFEL